MLKDHWTPGESCVLRGVVNGRVWLAQSVIVVKDAPEETILLLVPGAQCAYPEGYWRWKYGDYSQGTRWSEAKSETLVLRQFDWNTNRLLIFLEPQKYYSCFLFWNQETDRFGCYYINFQLPYQRSHCGFDSLDLDLDLVVDPDFSWHWKDEADYQQAIEEGGLQPQWVQEIERAKPEVFERLNQRRSPLNDSWLSWRPDPAWQPPHLPNRWQEV